MKTPARGVALVEFALVLPLLLVLAMVITEFGHALYLYNGAVKAARNAARYLAMQAPRTHVAEAVNLVVYGNPAGDGDPIDPHLTAAHVVIDDSSWKFEGSAPAINTVTVRVSGYTYQPMLTGMFGAAIGTMTFSDITATMRSAP